MQLPMSGADVYNLPEMQALLKRLGVKVDQNLTMLAIVADMQGLLRVTVGTLITDPKLEGVVDQMEVIATSVCEHCGSKVHCMPVVTETQRQMFDTEPDGESTAPLPPIPSAQETKHAPEEPA